MADYSDFEFIKTSYEDKVLVLTLNRPERLNAVHAPLHNELSRIFRRVNNDNDAWAVLITGEGRGFPSRDREPRAAALRPGLQRVGDTGSRRPDH